MKGKILTGVCSSVLTLVMVSCQDDRVVDRPLMTVTTPGAAVNNNALMQNFMQEGQQPQGSEFNPTPNNTSGGTIQNLLQNPAPTQPNIANNGGTFNQVTPTPNPVANPNTLPVLPNNNTVVAPKPAGDVIPVAVPTNDPTIVLSPYDKTKKIRISRKDNTPYPSGTILRDTNFPNEVKKFRVP